MFFKPERYFTRISCIDIKRDIIDCGFKKVLLDIDNTLLTRDTHEIPPDVMQWLCQLKKTNIDICLLSNNWHHGVYELAEKLELPLVAKAVKPLPHAFFLARKKIHAKRRDTLMIGDQLITDVWGAHAQGIAVYLLVPLVKTDLWHTLALRHIEKLFINGLAPEGAFSVAASDWVAQAGKVAQADKVAQAGKVAQADKVPQELTGGDLASEGAFSVATSDRVAQELSGENETASADKVAQAGKVAAAKTAFALG